MLVQTGYLKNMKMIYVSRQHNQTIGKLRHRTIITNRHIIWMLVTRRWLNGTQEIAISTAI